MIYNNLSSFARPPKKKSKKTPQIFYTYRIKNYNTNKTYINTLDLLFVMKKIEVFIIIL